MVGNGFFLLNFIYFWVSLYTNVLSEESSQAYTTSKNIKALKITNTTTVGVLPSDQEIILKYNSTILESTFNNLGALKHLTWINGYLDEADLKILKKFSDLESVAFIQTEGNITLTGEILKNLSELKEIVVHRNHRVILEDRSLQNLVNLQVVSADNQSFKSISSETFKNCRKLQYLSLSSGFLGDINEGTFNQLKTLISITLTRMSLKYLRKNTFYDLPMLYSIDLSHNKLSQVSGEEFNYLPRMEILNLEKNFLHAINAETIIQNVPKLNILAISENKFSCAVKIRLNNLFLRKNISSFEKKDLDRCRYATGVVQIFSA